MNRRLYRCRHDRRIAGVASGVAEYFGLDVPLVRVLWFVSLFVGGFSLLLYIGMWIIVPLEPMTEAELAASYAVPAWPSGVAGHQHRTSGESRWSLWIGLVLLLCGGLAMIDVVAPGWSASRYFGPLFLLGVGGILVVAAIGRRPSSAAATPPSSPTAPNPPTSPTESTPS